VKEHKIEHEGTNEAIDSTSYLAASATSTAVHVCVRATGYLADSFDFMDGGSRLNERGEAPGEVTLLTKAEELGSYISEHPMFAEGVCSMGEKDWLEVSRAARRLMLHQRRTTSAANGNGLNG
jgi:hypothetical protein